MTSKNPRGQKRQLSVIKQIAQAITTPQELSYLQTLPQFAEMPVEEVVQSTQHTLANYTGDKAFLNYVFDQTGTTNPWRASAQTELVDHVLRRSERDIRERGRVIGSTYRDQNLVRQLFHFVDPESGAFFNAGLTSAWKFRTAFGTPEQRTIIQSLYEDSGRVRETLDEQALAYLGSLQELMDEVKRDDGLLKRIRSTETKGAVVAVKEAENMLRELARAELDVRVESVAQVMSRLQMPIRTFQVERQDRNPLFTYMDEHIDEQRDVVQSAYRILRSIDGNYSEEVRQIAFGVVVGAYAQQHYVNARIVLASELEDIEYVSSLPEEHPLVQEHGRVNTTGLEDILGRHDVTVAEAARVLQANDFEGRRMTAWNAFATDEYALDLDRLPELFEGAFTDGEGNLVGSTVRKELTNEHEYRHVLVLGDWRVALDAYILPTLHGSVEQLVRQESIPRMREFADGAVVAVRKVQYLEQTLGELGVMSVEEIPLQAQQELALIRRGGYLPVERYHGDYEEVIDRLGHLHAQVGAGDLWRKHGDRLRSLTRAGLFDSKTGLEGVIPKLMRYTPLEEVPDYELARNVMSNPALNNTVEFLPYVNEQEIRLIQRIARTSITARTTTDDWDAYQEVQHTTVVGGGVKNKLVLRREMNPWGSAVSYTSWGASVLDGEQFGRMRSQLTHTTDDFVHGAKYMSKRSSTAMLKDVGLTPSDFGTWRFTHHELEEGMLVARSLHDIVQKTYDNLQKLEPMLVRFRFEEADKQFNEYNRRVGLFRFHPESASWYTEVPQRRIDETIRDVRAHSGQQPVFEEPKIINL